jgi:hypothetical protein
LAPLSDDDDDEAGSSAGDPAQIDVDIDMEDEEKEPGSSRDTNIVPMPPSGGIAALREKLHARMAALRRGGGGGRRFDYVNGNGNMNGPGEAGDRDELLEERRRQRAAMRERRRKETKEKIRKEEEMKGKKGKDREKEKRENRDKGNLTKVFIYAFVGYLFANSCSAYRHNYSSPT